MARVNREASYLYVIDGETVWERLRVVRSFLEERNLALSVALLGEDKVKNMDTSSFEYKEAQLRKNQTNSLIKDCEEEINFLQKLEKGLAVEAEKTRIVGKTDNEMYEINYFEELVCKHILDVRSEILATGRILPNTMKTLLRNPASAKRAIELQLLQPELLQGISPISDVSKQIGMTIDSTKRIG